MTASRTYPQFLLLGDSIVQYASLNKDGFSFGAALAEHCQRRLDIINRGLSGYNTEMELVVIDELIPAIENAKVDYALLLLGANDSCLENSRSEQHVPLNHYRENLKAMVNNSKLQAHNPLIMLVTPPPIHEVHLEAEDLAKGHKELSRRQAITSQYAQVVRGVAVEFKEQNVVLVDLNKAILDEAARLTPGVSVASRGLIGTKDAGHSQALRELLVDGLHLTGAGYKVFFDTVLPHVGQEWSQEPLNSPSWIFPHWTVAPKIER